MGDTGNGTFHRFPGDMEPPSLYGDYVEKVLQGIPYLHEWTRIALETEHPSMVFLSIQEEGYLMAINYSDMTAHIKKDGIFEGDLEPYSMARFILPPIESKQTFP